MVCVLVENLEWATPRIRQAPFDSYSPCWLVDHHLWPISVLWLWSEESPPCGQRKGSMGAPMCHTTSEAVPLMRQVLGHHKVLQSRTWALVGETVFCIPFSPLRTDISYGFLKQAGEWSNPTWFFIVGCCSSTLWKMRVVKKKIETKWPRITDKKYSLMNTKQQKLC